MHYALVGGLLGHKARAPPHLPPKTRAMEGGKGGNACPPIPSMQGQPIKEGGKGGNACPPNNAVADKFGGAKRGAAK